VQTRITSRSRYANDGTFLEDIFIYDSSKVLTWDMVDWKGRLLNIPRTKNEEAIHIPLNDAAVAALRVAHGQGDGRGRVFQSAKTGHLFKMGGIGSTTH
jgi:hypothetical protein